MMQFSARSANLLVTANGERVLEKVPLLRRGCLFLFEYIHLNVIKRKSKFS